MNRRRFAVVLAATAALAAAGCGGSDDAAPAGPSEPSNPFAAVAGTYTLRSAGGLTPPAVVDQSGTTTVEIIAEGITLEATGTWTMTTIRRTTTGTATSPGGVVSSTLHISDAGTFDASGNDIRLTSAGGNPAVSGTVVNGRLTTTRFNKPFVYQR